MSSSHEARSQRSLMGALPLPTGLGLLPEGVQVLQRLPSGRPARGVQEDGEVVGEGQVLRRRFQFPEDAGVHLARLAGGEVVEEGHQALQGRLVPPVLQAQPVEPEDAPAPLLVHQDGAGRAVFLQAVVNQGLQQRVPRGEELRPGPAGRLPLKGHPQSSREGVALQAPRLQELPGDAEAEDAGGLPVFGELAADGADGQAGEPLHVPGDEPPQEGIGLVPLDGGEVNVVARQGVLLQGAAELLQRSSTWMLSSTCSGSASSPATTACMMRSSRRTPSSRCPMTS
jgi:hypothetical protein